MIYWIIGGYLLVGVLTAFVLLLRSSVGSITAIVDGPRREDVVFSAIAGLLWPVAILLNLLMRIFS